MLLSYCLQWQSVLIFNSAARFLLFASIKFNADIELSSLTNSLTINMVIGSIMIAAASLLGNQSDRKDVINMMANRILLCIRKSKLNFVWNFWLQFFFTISGPIRKAWWPCRIFSRANRSSWTNWPTQSLIKKKLND